MPKTKKKKKPAGGGSNSNVDNRSNQLNPNNPVYHSSRGYSTSSAYDYNYGYSAHEAALAEAQRRRVLSEAKKKLEDAPQSPFTILGQWWMDFILMLLLLFFALRSHQALSGEGAQATQWLTFWTVCGFLQAAEYLVHPLWMRVPLYYELRLAFYIWLGFFHGAETVYRKFGKRATAKKTMHFLTKPQLRAVRQTGDARLLLTHSHEGLNQ